MASEPPKIPEPIRIVIEQKQEVPLPVEYTIEEKIKLNINNCDESIQWIRADTAECLLKPVIIPKTINVPQTRQSTVKSPQNGSNTYSACNCTYYAKQRRPDLPNNLGNANTWYSRASAQGYSVGYEPVAGAVGEATSGYMHVVYVESVDGDMVTVSEWNYSGPCQLTYRTVHKSNFRYIYISGV